MIFFGAKNVYKLNFVFGDAATKCDYDGFLAVTWRLLGGYLAVPGGYLAVTWRCLAVTWRLLGGFLAVDWRLLGGRWRSLGGCRAVTNSARPMESRAWLVGAALVGLKEGGGLQGTPPRGPRAPMQLINTLWLTDGLRENRQRQ